ncbi:MAG: Lrp/AsnC family transcriptional regulator [Candidatus Diapherotrites archaeon]|uniref:Lrp/AsnC family transcriptional regulator n=1 Tax=Candidatus Iainarchaeum sp. TaxID=3101447 RepID=A0A8T4C7X1_9ARCH|nr:Lrp/AsnC family transcriptional regulator [Candidatus Diapherotrites archaeon]
MKNGLSLKEKQVLIELGKNARLSDRELASRLKTSQPTVTRIRTKLMDNGFVDRFMILPRLDKLGLRFHAFTFVRTTSLAVSKKISAWGAEQSCVVFASEGDGLRNHSVVLESVHEDYHEYALMTRSLKEKFAGQWIDVSPFFTDVSSISKFYQWHSLIEDRASKIILENVEKRVSNRERLRAALEKIPNPLERIPNPLRGREGRDEKEGKTVSPDKETENEK